MFAHGRNQRHVFRLTGCQQPPVEVPNSRVVAAGATKPQPPESCPLPVRVSPWLDYGTAWQAVIRYACIAVPMWVPRRPKCPRSDL